MSYCVMQGMGDASYQYIAPRTSGDSNTQGSFAPPLPPPHHLGVVGGCGILIIELSSSAES